MRALNKPTLTVLNENRLMLLSILSNFRKRYQIKAFSSGAMALNYLSDNLTDLIIIGDKTSDLSGHEVLDKLQSDNNMRMIPSIFLSNPIEENSGLQALTKGAADYISEPVEPRALLKRIYTHLELRNLGEHLTTLAEGKSTNLNSNPNKLKYAISDLLAQITSLLDNETGDHLKRTTEYVRVIVSYLLNQPQPDYYLTEFEAVNIMNAAKLHDLGKLVIPNQLLNKPAKLTDEEFEIIKQHPIKGANLLNAILSQSGAGEDFFLKTAYEIALNHHEKWNGQGYPKNLKENDIPLSARIVALADVYDALTHARSYRTAFSHLQAMEIIEKETGAHFDPYLVEVFLNNEQKFKNVDLYTMAN